MANFDDHDPSTTSRRGLLTAVAATLGVGVAASVLGPVLIFAGHPLGHDTTSGDGDFLPAGPPTLFPGRTPVKVDLFADRIDAWNRVVAVKVGSAWVRREGGKLVALSNVCPHLGCGVDYDANVDKYYCACHKSYFGLDGACQTGPSPRGLDSLDVQEDATLVSIRYQRFKIGIANKEPIA